MVTDQDWLADVVGDEFPEGAIFTPGDGPQLTVVWWDGQTQWDGTPMSKILIDLDPELRAQWERGDKPRRANIEDVMQGVVDNRLDEYEDHAASDGPFVIRLEHQP
ncbi:hypothetical protein PTE30175_04547 [Pandoraea terrae]|uniref:Uncharacterized protein n=1 Tax=Pandoraea terrae TaxID=1537710 RepID=A0A5E4YQW0_9BURK|nr:hypothetical protein [Pandoraea terrae]VVE50303.1 hypothetical protein PTE30175_04547 [Pandoraea terrae]